MSDIQKELMTATKIKPEKYQDRQDFLAAITRFMSDKMKDDDYFGLSDGSMKWYETAVGAMDKKREIPDFPDLEPLDEYPEDSERERSQGDTAPAEPVRATEGNEEELSVGPEENKKVGKGKKQRMPTRYDNITGEKDRYGIVKGTKAAEAIAMFEKGRSMAQVTEALEGKFYNLVKRLIKDGHLMEKLDGNVFKLTHKDDVAK